MTGRSDLLQLDAAEQLLLPILEIDYAPVIEAFEQLRLVDAENHLQSVLDKIQRIETSG